MYSICLALLLDLEHLLLQQLGRCPAWIAWILIKDIHISSAVLTVLEKLAGRRGAAGDARASRAVAAVVPWAARRAGWRPGPEGYRHLHGAEGRPQRDQGGVSAIAFYQQTTKHQSSSKVSMFKTKNRPKLRQAKLLTKTILGILIDIQFLVSTLEIYPYWIQPTPSHARAATDGGAGRVHGVGALKKGTPFRYFILYIIIF